MKRQYKILLILAGALALLVLVIVANVSRSHQQVRGIEAKLRYGNVPVLVDSQTVVDSIMAAIPQLVTQQVGDVDRDAVVAAAAHVPYLRDISASVSVSGKVVVRATQRRPIARLFYGNRELYFDADGVIMPASRIGECNVLVAGGDFAEPLRRDSLNSQMLDLLTVALFLDADRRYRGLIDQIYSERNGNIMMASKLGDQLIELGSASDLPLKFSNLLEFYRRGMPRAGWDTYSKISLKYDNQVVCTKKNKK